MSTRSLPGWLRTAVALLALVVLAPSATVRAQPLPAPAPDAPRPDPEPEAAAIDEDDETPSLDRVEPLSDAEQARLDARLEARLRGALDRIAPLQDLQSSVRDGVVVLTGQLGSAALRDEAVGLARRLRGVLYVDDRIEVDPSNGDAAAPKPSGAPDANDEAIARRLASIFDQVESLADVQITVHTGVVTLAGTVDTDSTAERAIELAGGMDGVVFVDDQLEVSRDVGERLPSALDTLRERGAALLATLPLVGVALVIVGLFWFGGRWLSRRDRLFSLLSKKPLVREILAQVARTLVVLTGLLIALDLLELTTVVGAVLGTAGLLGLVIGFAFQDIIKNYLASLILSVRRPFGQDDEVFIGEHHGIVLNMTTRDTVLMTLDGNHVRIPNGTVFDSVITNLTRNPRRRCSFDVGIDPALDIAHAQRLAMDTLRAVDGILDDPEPLVLVEALGDSNVVLRAMAWVDQRADSFLSVRSRAIRAVKNAFDLGGVSMPEPVFRLLLKQLDDAEQPAAELPERATYEVNAEAVEPAEQSPEAHTEAVETSARRQVEDDRRQHPESGLL